MEVDFHKTDMADAAELVPGAKRLGPRTIGFAVDLDTFFKVQELIFMRLRYE
jgi:D-aminopeptidase